MEPQASGLDRCMTRCSAAFDNANKFRVTSTANVTLTLHLVEWIY